MLEHVILIILEAIVSLGVLAFCRYAIPWIKTKFSKDTIDFISKWVKEAVKSAEQIHGDGNGSVKKEEVLNFVHEILQSYNIKLSEEAIDTLIEAAVKQLKIELLQASSN